MSATKLMWIVANTCGAPMLKGYDFAFIELWTKVDDSLRQYIIDGEGNLWFPNVGPGAVQAKPIGKLMAIVPSGCDKKARQAAINFCGIGAGHKVVVIAANGEEAEG